MIHQGISMLSAAALSLALASGDAPPPHGPPPEAFDACAGKTEGANPSVTFHDKTLDGTCLSPPKDAGETRLFCAPPHPPDHS